MKIYPDVLCAACNQKQPDPVQSGIFQCTVCQSRNLVITDNKNRVYEIISDTGENDALNSVARFLSAQKSVDARFLETFKSGSRPTLYYVPFYLSQGTTAVCFTVRKQVENKETILLPGGKILYSKRGKPLLTGTETRVQFTEFFNCICAVTDLDWGLRDADLSDLPQIHLDDFSRIHSRGRVLTPTLTRETFERLQHDTGRREGDYKRDVITQEDNMLYLPVWRITTWNKGVVYDAFVNAATGDCVKASAPESADARAMSFSISFAVTAFVSSMIIVFSKFLYSFVFRETNVVFPGIDLIVLLLILIMMGCVCLLAALAGHGWDRVKHTYEIVKTPTRVFVHPLDKSTDTWLDNVHDATLNLLTGQLEGMAHIEH